MDTSLEGTIKFVELIQKHPVIYARNRTSLDPGPEAFDAAWNDVASQTGGNSPDRWLTYRVALALSRQGTLRECKHRWRRLLCLYSKYLKKIVSQVNPHGIEPYLSFLTPIISPASEEGQLLEDRYEYNVKLVNLVRRRPCLYDGTEVKTRPACWAEIAQRLQEDYPDTAVTAERCKRKFADIRLAYNTYLKKGHRFRPYGIEEHLSFLTPHLQYVQSERQVLLWSDKKLIDLVQIHPCLYDGTDHKNIEVWTDVADAMGGTTSPLKCLNRWLILRDAFQRHLLDGRPMQPRGLEQRLSFLDPYIDFEAEIPPVAKMSPLAKMLGHIPFHAADHDARDVQFVMELVKTMKVMSDAQKRQFRLGAVKLAREILGE